MTYRFMKSHETEFAVEGMCHVFGVSRSGYYAWRKRGESTCREPIDRELTERIVTIFERSHQTYGSPRIYAELKAQGIVCRRDQVAHLMRQAHLIATLSRRWVQTTRSDGQPRSVGNFLNRDFSAQTSNQKWVVDMTAIGTDEGGLYLAGVLDLFSRDIVGWAMDEHMPDELTQAALEMAILHRRPPSQLLYHSDQDSQYTSDEYQALLAKHNMLVSFRGWAAVTIMHRWRVSGELSKPNSSITNTTLYVLIPNLPFSLISKAGITASVAIHRWAISATSNSNISFRLSCVSISLGHGRGSYIAES